MSDNNECSICGNSLNNSYIQAAEMMLKMGGRFNYLDCSNCGCISLVDIVDDIGRYYPKNYYSFTYKSTGDTKLLKAKNYVRKRSMMGALGSKNIIDRFFCNVKKVSYSWIKKDLVNLNSKVLDVGCGNGFLISDMRNYGFMNLYGIDQYTNESCNDIEKKHSKSDIHSYDGDDFDLIMYHHSFEHISEPHKELMSIHQKLNDDGVLLIRVPVSDSYAFRKYREKWVQFDAPRHHFLYSTKSIVELSAKNGFIVDDIKYDSSSFQFTGSECYLRGLSMGEYNAIFSKKELKVINRKVEELNLMGDGDSACFYLKKFLP